MWSYLAVLLVFSATTAEPAGDAGRHQVIIVGGGLSGFTAAATLLEHNVTDILVLEAADRIGGRVHTVEFGGMDVDLGAEYVSGVSSDSVFDMVNSSNVLTLYETNLNPEKNLYFNASGDIVNATNVIDLVAEAYSIYKSSKMQHINGSVADFFYSRLPEVLDGLTDDQGLKEAVGRYTALLEVVFDGVSNLTQLPAWGFSQSPDYSDEDMYMWKSGGFIQILDFLSRKLPHPEEALPVSEKTLFGKEVRRVEQKDGGVEVRCADGSTYLADHVIVTVSLGVLKKHAATMFHPPLPTDKTKAIETMGFGCLGKIFLLFPKRWWPDNIHLIIPLFSQQELKDFIANSTHGYWTAYTTGFNPVMLHDRMMEVWLCGEVCFNLDHLTNDQVIDGLMEFLDRFVGKKFDIPRPEKMLRSSWATYPYTLGSYSFGSAEADKYNITNEDLARPVMDGEKPVILFAGEATHPKYHSTVHGALSTGRREADNLLRYLNSEGPKLRAQIGI